MHMENIKVNADLNEIGEEMIFTLKDQNILEGEQLNNEGDELENEIIRENDRQELKKKMEDKIKKKKEYYNALEEENKGEAKKKILDQYDEVKLEKEGFYISQDGNIVEDKKKQIETIQQKLKAKKGNEISLYFEDQIATDYKPAFKTTFSKKKVKKNNQNDDFAKQDQFQQKENLDQAIDLVDDEEQQLQKSLELQRISKLKGKQEFKREDKLKYLIEKNKQLEETQTLLNKEALIRPKPKQHTKEDGKEEINIISSSTDFLKNVRTEKELQENNLRISAPTPYSIKDSKDGYASIINVSLPTERLVGLSRIRNTQENQRLDVNSFLAEEEQEELDKAKEEVNFLDEENMGKGLAGALKSLRERGMLNEDNYDYIGRAKDEKKANKEQNYDKIQLEYRDTTGRLMTPKEAFRYECWIFHGKGPGKKKMEKRKKILNNLEKVKTTVPGESPLMKTLQYEQQKNKNAYMVISSKKNQKE